MSARRKRGQINLLPQEEFKATTPGRILTWLMSTFRYIVIVTEMIVMGAFMSRFWLDAQSNDLNDTLAQKTAIIQSTSDFENDFKTTQSQLKVISELRGTPANSVLSKIASHLPKDVVLTSYSLTGNNVKAQGVSSSERSIAQFIANLESNEDLSDVSLTQVDTDDLNVALLIFSIKVSYKGG